ncbi:MAG TPA: hypothetical protein VND65_15665 [Candidatus Binatia bacterium]|nr:hypothetical protein [Candidatus Binatia bacterium]
MRNFTPLMRSILVAAMASLLPILFSIASPAQDFTMTIPLGLRTPAVDPGGTSTATIDLSPVGTSAGPVSLTCAVTTTVSTPTCLISPSSATPPATPALTVSTTTSTPTGSYPITVTGTDASGAVTLNLTLSVTDLTADYTLSVSPTTATPSPIPAGSSATSTVTITPSSNYSGNVTLSCLSVTPVVVAAPFCTFQYPNGASSIAVGGGVPSTVGMTITAYGPSPSTRNGTPRIYYALWLVLPALTLAGFGAGMGGKKWPALFLLLGLGVGVLFLPACNNSSYQTTNNSPQGLSTPKNTYTFALSAADQNGAQPSNATSGTGAATVTLGVTN